MIKTTDTWFRSERPLEAIADVLGLSEVSFDGENYWEWVIGTLVVEQIQLDITRTHTVPPHLTETRTFRVDLEPFSNAQIKMVNSLLKPIANAGVRWGEWRYQRGNAFEIIETGRRL